jgi:eukaryotic-like serine/threonine-protein kinase
MATDPPATTSPPKAVLEELNTLSLESLSNLDTISLEDYLQEKSTCLGEKKCKTPTLHEAYSDINWIAAGGMSDIYSAQQSVLKRKIAIKRCNRDSPILRRMIEAEAQILGGLEHPNIPPVYNIVPAEEGDPAVILKFIDGKTLHELLQSCESPAERVDLAVPILLQICYALAFAHTHGILHRDIKPSNIMVGEFGVIYLLDWGIAMDLNQRAAIPNRVVGTPHYMPPEMLSENPVLDSNKYSDIYLLGATLHEVLTGETRHSGSELQEIFLQANLSKPTEYPQMLKGLGELCNEACSRDPKDRPPSVESFQARLAQLFSCWQGRDQLEEALIAVAQLRHQKPSQNPLEDTHVRVNILQHYSKTRFSLEAVLRRSPTNTKAKEALIQLKNQMLDHYIHTQQLDLALALVRELNEPSDAIITKIQDLRGILREKLEKELRAEILDQEFDHATTQRFRKTLGSSMLGTSLLLLLWHGLWGASNDTLTMALGIQSLVLFSWTGLNWRAFRRKRFPRVISFVGMGFGLMFVNAFIFSEMGATPTRLTQFFSLVLVFMATGTLADIRAHRWKLLALGTLASIGWIYSPWAIDLFLITMALLSGFLFQEWHKLPTQQKDWGPG